jgi:hypothetical protein
MRRTTVQRVIFLMRFEAVFCCLWQVAGHSDN